MLSRIYANVQLGANVHVGDFVVLGHPPHGHAPGALALEIGSDSLIRSHSIIYAGTSVGSRFATGHGVLIREGCHVGNDCSVGSGSVLEFDVTIGSGVRIHSRAFIPELSVLEDDCWIGPNVVITNSKYPRSRRSKDTLHGVRVCRGAKIGANVTLLPGLVIGEDALVGAGTVVTRNIDPGCVVVGNPGRVVARIEDLRYDGTAELAYPRGQS